MGHIGESSDLAAQAVGSPPLRLFLVRHGETEWSVSGQHTGCTDIALTARGEDQARALAPSLAKIHFDHVFSSPASRARHTCVLTGLGAQIEEEPGLAEWNYGAYEGLRSQAIREERPGWSVYHDGCPDGETPTEVSDRADHLIDRLQTLSGNIALFSHGQFGCSLAVRWIGLPILQAQHFLMETASLCVLGYNPGHPELRIIGAWNSAYRP